MRSIMQIGTVVLAGIMNTYILAMGGAWVWMALFGILFPAVGLYDWVVARKREPPEQVNRIIAYLLAGQIAIFALASRPTWSNSQAERCGPVDAEGADADQP